MGFKETVVIVLCKLLLFLIDVVSALVFSFYYKGKSKPLPPITNGILLQSAESLATKIRSGQLKSKTLLEAYINRIKEVNPILNAVVDERFEEALKDAEKVDNLIASGKKTEAQLAQETPLLGLPFTIKESFQVKGLRQTVGLVSRKDAVATEDAEVIQLMKKAGAIPLAVTNVPELCYWLETHNHVYGRTYNPYDTTRIVGGSSGGEGSLQSAAGSIISIGADIGGSIRLPSFANGIFGHKPSSEIVPLGGQLPKSMEELYQFNTIGPMCRYAGDLPLVYKVLASPNLNKLTLDKKVDVRSLRVFYMKSDEGFLTTRVHPEIRKAEEKVVKYFQEISENYVKEVHIPELKYSFQIFRKVFGEYSNISLAEEATDRQGKISPWLELGKSLVGRSDFTIHTIYNCLIESINTPDEYLTSFETLKHRFETMLGEDCIFLYPTQPIPADYHLRSVLMPFNFSYTGIFNILGLPSTSCPLGLSSQGLPLGLQVVAGKYNDHLCLAVAKELEKAFGGWVSPSAVL